jgi:hypothetical protein
VECLGDVSAAYDFGGIERVHAGSAQRLPQNLFNGCCAGKRHTRLKDLAWTVSRTASNRFLAKTEDCSADRQVWVRPHASAHGPLAESSTCDAPGCQKSTLMAVGLR